MKVCTDVPLKWVNFLSFQMYGWIVNCPLQCVNGWGFLNYDISIGHISTIPWSFFIVKTNSSILMV